MACAKCTYMKFDVRMSKLLSNVVKVNFIYK